MNIHGNYSTWSKLIGVRIHWVPINGKRCYAGDMGAYFPCELILCPDFTVNLKGVLGGLQ